MPTHAQVKRTACSRVAAAAATAASANRWSSLANADTNGEANVVVVVDADVFIDDAALKLQIYGKAFAACAYKLQQQQQQQRKPQERA